MLHQCPFLQNGMLCFGRPNRPVLACLHASASSTGLIVCQAAAYQLALADYFVLGLLGLAMQAVALLSVTLQNGT